MTEQDAFEESLYLGRPVLKPTAATWMRHIFLLAVTLCTATVAGTLFPFGKYTTLPDDDPETLTELARFIFTVPERYAVFILDAINNIFAEPANLAYGLKFSLSLLFILICHEMGHYVACRLYRVDATLPFFLPTPPMIGPAGTFGAFIKILSPMPTRRAIFDIGVAGPIAGFIALLPVAVAGVCDDEFGTADDIQAGNISPISFSDPLLLKLFGLFAGVDPTLPMEPNPFYFAAWVGVLVTAFNLIPSGQLDGGQRCLPSLAKRSPLDRFHSVRRDGISFDLGDGVLQQPERIPDRGHPGNNDADQAPEALGHNTARYQKQGHRRDDRSDLCLVFCAVSDTDQLLKFTLAFLLKVGRRPLISLTIFSTSSWPSRAIIKKS